MVTKKIKRPEIGKVTTTTIRIPICGMCGDEIDLGLCSPDCSEFADSVPAFYAVYERTDKFLRDEPALR